MSKTVLGNVTRERVFEFCGEMNMPPEVTAAVDAACDTPVSHELAAWCQQLLAPGEADDAAGKLHAWACAHSGWATELALHLVAALHALDGIYYERHIPYTVFLDTMACFSRFVNEHKVTFGVYGFDRGDWTWRQICGLLFRLGCLEFEMIEFTQNFPKEGLAPETRVLSVHIPSDAALRRESTTASYRQAYDFFARYFPEFQYEAVYCGSWLLAPGLDGMLPSGSGIRSFRQDYRLIHENPNDRSYLQWVFKLGSSAIPENPVNLPEDTSLQREAKRLILAGGNLGSGLALLEPEGRRFSFKCNAFASL